MRTGITTTPIIQGTGITNPWSYVPTDYISMTNAGSYGDYAIGIGFKAPGLLMPGDTVQLEFAYISGVNIADVLTIIGFSAVGGNAGSNSATPSVTPSKTPTPVSKSAARARVCVCAVRLRMWERTRRWHRRMNMRALTHRCVI